MSFSPPLAFFGGNLPAIGLGADNKNNKNNMNPIMFSAFIMRIMRN
jgi:hypothetical protein